MLLTSELIAVPTSAITAAASSGDCDASRAANPSRLSSTISRPTNQQLYCQKLIMILVWES